MIKVSNVETFNLKNAIRGMRNPLNSWELSDSHDDTIGDKDLELAQRLRKAGTTHRKYLRQIFVCMDILAPLYWWKEFDTYKVGTTSNSCSTMHKIHAKSFELKDFSIERLDDNQIETFRIVIDALNTARYNYNSTKVKDYWYQMIQLLPSSYNQLRTITMTYENALAMIEQRSSHKLKEWRMFCDILLNELPYLKDFINE